MDLSSVTVQDPLTPASRGIVRSRLNQLYLLCTYLAAFEPFWRFWRIASFKFRANPRIPPDRIPLPPPL
jgi:hypothetical protein